MRRGPDLVLHVHGMPGIGLRVAGRPVRPHHAVCGLQSRAVQRLGCCSSVPGLPCTAVELASHSKDTSEGLKSAVSWQAGPDEHGAGLIGR